MTSALKPEPPSTHPSVSALGTPATKHEQLPILEPGAVVNETPQQLGAWNKRLRLMGAILLPVFVGNKLNVSRILPWLNECDCLRNARLHGSRNRTTAYCLRI